MSSVDLLLQTPFNKQQGLCWGRSVIHSKLPQVLGWDWGLLDVFFVVVCIVLSVSLQAKPRTAVG